VNDREEEAWHICNGHPRHICYPAPAAHPHCASADKPADGAGNLAAGEGEALTVGTAWLMSLGQATRASN